MKHVYAPKPTDFRRLRGYVRKHRKIYLEKYQPLRHQVFAHKGLSDAADVSALFAKTNVRELQRMLVFLMLLYDALWGLFVNGHRPVLRPRRYSVKRMRDRAAKIRVAARCSNAWSMKPSISLKPRAQRCR